MDHNNRIATERFFEFMNQTPFFSWAGLKIIDAHNGEATIALEVQDHHRGGGGTEAINGGIVAYMFDGLLGMAIASKWGSDIIGQVTVSLNIEYLRMIQASTMVMGKGRVVQLTKTLAFAEGEVYDEKQVLCAKCTGIYKVFRSNA
ncbi:MAG: PaaI family thioesterase [Deferribacterota bacterium]|nr:PaaI family thioesterase [Deferribacterota bacterium]